MFVNRLPCWKTLCILIFIIYLLFTIYSAYVILYKDDQLSPQRAVAPLKYEQDRKIPTKPSITLNKNLQSSFKPNGRRVVHIWGKAAIGLYLWEHILGGSLDTSDGGLTYSGTVISDHIEFRFLTGPGVIQGRVPTDVKHLVLVINGREEAKISFARTWLDYLEYLPELEGVAVVMLGDEKCQNDWIVKYARRRNGKVRAVWLTYDTPLVDNILFYQWPLGVATYRNFPRLDPSQIDVETSRSNICNFIGTVYPDSSRTELINVINRTTNSCVLKLRYSWEAEETDESLVNYVTTLLDSDLTLSPVGQNSECYRIYEALSCGSTPVVEDVMTDGKCGGMSRTPYRLLKLHSAPIVYVKNWTNDIPRVMERQRRLSDKMKAKMRLKALIWYHNFTAYLKKHFIKVVKNRLLKL